MTWLNDISKNEEYWIAGAEDNYPCVIAFEYKRLRQMCQDSKAYGVLLCLKDNFESLLKFETLISCAWAVENLDDKFEEDTIAEITKPQLSFGEWEYLAKTIINDMRKYDKKLPDYIPLKEIIESYGEPNNIVKWRNSRIGHGVMGFEEDDDFRIDIINYIKIYTEILRKIDEKLRLQRLYIVNDDERIDLTGADKVKSIPYDGELWIRVASGDSMDSFRLNPFLKISNNQKIKWGLYFFETYKRVSVFQEYAEGLVDSTRDGYFEKLSRCLIGKNISRNSNASNRYKSFAEYRELDPYISKEEYVYPEHLIKWLKDCVVRYDKGIFLLKMSRGTGKSVFTDKLSSLFEKPLKIDANFDVRTYHLNRIQAAGEEDFYIYIREMWNHTYNGNPYMGIPSIKELIHEVATPAEAFAEYLRCVLNSRRERDYDKKIMMVFDGLDEVVIDRVRDILPDEELISEGIYILYTMRDPANEKLPSSLMEYVDNLNVSEEHTVALESEENVAFLSTYISRYKFKGDDLKKRLIKASSYRILDLALICALYQKDKGIDELEKVESFVNMYFSYIEEQYTENEFSKLKEIIVILAVFGDKEVLTLRKIGDLSSDSEITLRLVGMMKDLNPLLDITRDKEGNRYRIVNEDVANELLLQIPEKNTIIRQFVNMAIAVIEEGEIPELHSGDEVLCAHVTELALMLPEGIAAMGEQRDVLFDVFFGNISEWSVNDSYEREIKVRYLRQVYRVYQEVYGEDGVNTILVKLFLSDLLFAQGNYEEAQKICNDLLEDVKKHSDCPGWMVVRLLNDNTAVYNEQGKAEEAIELYKKYEKYISESEDDGGLFWTYKNAVAYAYVINGQIEEARSIVSELEERLTGTFALESENLFAIKNHISDFYLIIGELENAFEPTREAYELAVMIYGDNSIPALAAMGSYSLLLGIKGEMDESVKKSKTAYEGLRNLLGADNPTTVKVHSDFAISLFASGKYSESIDMMNDVYDILVKIYGEEHYMIAEWRNKISYMKKYWEYKSVINNKWDELLKIQEKYGESHINSLKAERIHLSKLIEHYDYEHTMEKDYAEYLRILRKILHVEQEYDYDTILRIAEEVYNKHIEILGDEDPGTATCMVYLARIHSLYDRVDLAIELQKKVISIREKTIGADNEITIASIRRLISYYKKIGDIEKSSELEKKLNGI